MIDNLLGLIVLLFSGKGRGGVCMRCIYYVGSGIRMFLMFFVVELLV